MKRTIFSIMLCLKLLLFSSTIVAQRSDTLLRIVETDENGRNIILQPNYKVVEPNSTLTVTINKALLLAKLPQTQLSPEITGRLVFLRKMIAAEQDAIKEVQNAILAYNANASDSTALAELHSLRPLVILVGSDPEAKRIFAEELRRLSPGIINSYRALFATAHRLVDRVQEQILKEAKEKGVYLQLGAWLDTKGTQTSIHIPRYDDYAYQPSYQVERFQYSLSPEQKKELDELGKIADAANKDGLGAAFADKINAKELLNTFRSLRSVKAIEEMSRNLEALIGKSDAELGAFKKVLNDTYQSVNGFNAVITATINSFANITTTNDPVRIANALAASVQDLLDEVGVIKPVLLGYASQINDIRVATNASVNTDAKKLMDTLLQVPAMLQSDLEKFMVSRDNLLDLLGLGKSLAERTHAFTDKVRKNALDQPMPDAVINLQLSGKRQQGDLLTIKLATGTAAGGLELQQELNYSLYFCSFYAKTTTGLLFVDPFPVFQREAEQAWLRFAPSYSVLFKGFWHSKETSRKKLGYHKYNAPGIGFNFAAINFGGNGATDLGLGLVYSALNDFFQIGAGVNTFSGQGYGFLGLKIPVGEFTFR
jgi:hypothetical protein